jgi:group I intron endonuclease
MTGRLYLLTSPSGKQYVGITSGDVSVRWKGHVRSAKRGDRRPLASAIRKYGPDAFAIEDLGETTWDRLNTLEQISIQVLGTLHPKGYNLRSGGGQGRHHPESRQKIRNAKLGVRRSPESVRKQSEALRGRKLSEEHRAKISEFMKGKKWNLGRKHSEESRRNMGNSHVGSKRSDETRQKMSEARKKWWEARKNG